MLVRVDKIVVIVQLDERSVLCEPPIAMALCCFGMSFLLLKMLGGRQGVGGN